MFVEKEVVDGSAPTIVGGFLEDKDRSQLHEWARAGNLWERRIAIISTFYFIDRGECGESLALAELLLNDGEDLIHKASGWVLREVGKKEFRLLESFLKAHCRRMPRTMLRYAIEKLPQKSRRLYLKGEV